MTLKDDSDPHLTLHGPASAPGQPQAAEPLFGPILRAALAPDATPRDPLEALREQATYALAVMSYHGSLWGRRMAEVGGLLHQAKALRPEEWEDFVESLGLTPEAVGGFLGMHEAVEKMRREGRNAAGALRRQ